MPTYRNNRAGAIHLTDKKSRMIGPGDEFIADPSEIPKSWLESQGAQPPLVTKITDADKKVLAKGTDQAGAAPVAHESDVDLPTHADAQIGDRSRPSTRSAIPEDDKSEASAAARVDMVKQPPVERVRQETGAADLHTDQQTTRAAEAAKADAAVRAAEQQGTRAAEAAKAAAQATKKPADKDEKKS